MRKHLKPIRRGNTRRIS